MRRKISATGKISVLIKIRDNKIILFGALANNITKESKIEIWTDILKVAQSLGVVPENKNWTYMRDVFWQNCRKYALLKIENSRKTGTAGGKECKLSTCDDIVLDIIGKDSEAIVGLGVEESMSSTNDCHASCSTKGNENAADVSEADRCNRQLSASSGKKRRNMEESQLNLNKKKLMIEHLELLNTKLKLEISLLRKKLGNSSGIESAGAHEGKGAEDEESEDDHNQISFFSDE